MNISTLSNIPISMGQRTPQILRKTQMGRSIESYDELISRQEAQSHLGHRPYIPSPYTTKPSTSLFEPAFTDSLGRPEPSYRDDGYLRKSTPDFSSSMIKTYKPLETLGRSHVTNLYAPNTLDTYVTRPELLLTIVRIFNYVNSLLVFGTTYAFLYVVLRFISFSIQNEEFSAGSYQFFRIMIFFCILLFAKAQMFHHYDIFINWNDLLRDLLTKVSFLHLGLLISFIGKIAFTIDIFSVITQSEASNEVPQVVIIAIINSFSDIKRFLKTKQYLLDSPSFETNWSYLSEYSPRRLLDIAVQFVGQSLKMTIISSFLCYSGLISLFLEETAPSFSYEYMQFPGLWKALERAAKHFVIIWCTNFIMEVQTQVMRRIWIRILEKMGDTRFTTQPLYYFYNVFKGDEILLGHCLRFLDTKLRYECRNSLIRKQNPGDPESKTFWHVLSEVTLDRLERLNIELQKLKGSSLVSTGNFGGQMRNDNVLAILEAFFTSTPEVKALRNLYHEVNISTHHFKVMNRAFREMKMLNMDMGLRAFNVSIQNYYQGLVSVYNTLGQIKRINRSGYVDTFLTRISPFEEVITEGLLMLNKFISVQ